ncbi:hypothetical protein NECAME_04092 [Necator americanus]|uniref:Histone deacetylase domain-containing protein n=1 Tax=Necator americanus TaxID=51031 RepID=W2SZS5_NECAM|nr:hypothetical protein NECAME_04092 [Necator americanus]ETN74227.1 hypothetical protein NECAME_04092 [Necator americanus]
MVRLLNEICPNRIVAVLEGGYYPTNYTEAASMMVRGLQRTSDNFPKIPYAKDQIASAGLRKWAKRNEHSRRGICLTGCRDFRLERTEGRSGCQAENEVGVQQKRRAHPVGLPLPNLNLGRLSPAFKETMWNNIVHHSSRYPLLQEWLEKLQANQIPPPCSIKGMRELYEETKRTRAVRTREWFPDLNIEQKKSCDEAIAAYVKMYDYSVPSSDPSEQFLLEQMTWTERSSVEAFAHSAPICLFFVREFTDFVEGKRKSTMICDRELMAGQCLTRSCEQLFEFAIQ